jgi:type I restriction enzyme S subunit
LSWSTVELGSVCQRVSVGHVGKTSEFYTDEAGVPFLRTQNVASNGVIFDDVKYITREFHEKLKKSTLAAGDVILSRVISTTINCGIVPKSLDGANCANIILARPDSNKLDSRFLVYYLRSGATQSKLLKRQVGSAQSVVNTSVLKSWEIPLPPLTEQKRIAAILDKADAIRRKRQQAIELADDFLRAVFLDMFGDPVTNSKNWSLLAIKDLATVTTGNTPPRKVQEYYGKDVEWIKSDNINTPNHILTTATEYLSYSGIKVARTVPEGSTLITCIAGSFDCIGNVAYTDREVSFNQQINALTPKSGVLGWFLYALILFSKKTIQNASTNSMKGMVSKGKLQEVKLIHPPIELQQEFENILHKQINATNHLNKSYRNTCNLFNSLSEKAFSGQL